MFKIFSKYICLDGSCAVRHMSLGAKGLTHCNTMHGTHNVKLQGVFVAGITTVSRQPLLGRKCRVVSYTSTLSITLPSYDVQIWNRIKGLIY